MSRELPLPFDLAEVRVVLLDVEGTTTPVDFVFKTLFPFAAARVEMFLERNSESPAVQTLIGELRSTWSGAASAGAPVWVESSPQEKLASAAAYLRWLIANDSKMTPLKTLQGMIWEQGFRRGELKGEVFADVPRAFSRWRDQSKRIAIFSSGSVLAQKLLFTHSTAGDLSPNIANYFDTTTGPKRVPESYKKIAAALGEEGQRILFISDVPAELDAAARAHMKTALSLRPGAPAPSGSVHPAIQTFDGL